MVALITGGGSAKEAWKDSLSSRYESVIGVNWAAHHFKVDWLVALDAIVWRIGEMIMPDAGLVSYETQPNDVSSILSDNELQLVPFGDRMTDKAQGLCSFTFPYALRFCLEKWLDSEIDVYGLDMDNDRGLCPGGPDKRKPNQRWLNEEPFIRQLFHEHGDRINLIGCKVEPLRIRKDQESYQSAHCIR